MDDKKMENLIVNIGEPVFAGTAGLYGQFCVLQVKNLKIASKNGESCNSVLEKIAAIPAELSSSAMTVLQTYFQVNSYRFIRSWRSAMFL